MDFNLLLILGIFGGIGGIFATLSFIVFLFLEWPRFKVRLRENIGTFIGASLFIWLPEGRTLVIEGVVSKDVNMIIGTLIGVLIIAAIGAFIGSSTQNTFVSLLWENRFE